MNHSVSAHLAGAASSVSMIAPVIVMMYFWSRWDWTVLAVVALMSLPFYFMTRNRISMEKDHPGWRARFSGPLP